MKIFLAGATGALGRQLLPLLVQRGHDVTGMTRTEAKQQLVQELGGRPVVADALDPESVADAVARAEPDVIVHQLTAIPYALDMRHFARDFAQTNRLRTEGTDYLLAAGRAVGVRRFVAQSYAPAVFARVGGPVKAEQDPVDASPPKEVRTTLEAIMHLERAVTGATWTEGVVLRYGGFYGPGTNISFGPEGSRRRREELAERFFAAAGDGDLQTLESLLAEDVELHGDGGGRVPALARPLHGRRGVARTLNSWIRLGRRAGGLEVRRVEVNGEPGAVITDANSGLIGVWSLGIAEDRIQSVRSIVNPDKLAHLGPVRGLTAVLELRTTASVGPSATA